MEQEPILPIFAHIPLEPIMRMTRITFSAHKRVELPLNEFAAPVIEVVLFDKAMNKTPVLKGLLDTGAFYNIAPMSKLSGLLLENPVKIKTGDMNGIAHSLNQYQVKIYIPVFDFSVPFLIATSDIAKNNTSQFDFVIGTDFLQYFRLDYLGSQNKFVLETGP